MNTTVQEGTQEARVLGGARTGQSSSPDQERSTEIDELRYALEVMGLGALDPADVEEDFRHPLYRLASAWRAALSPSTLASRRCDLRRFGEWCAARGAAPFQSDGDLSTLFRDHLAVIGQTYTPGTAKRVGSNLTALAKGVGSDEAVLAAQDWRIKAVRAAQKVARAEGVVREKPYLTVLQMQALRTQIDPANALPLRRLRDLPLFDTMCDLLARRSEMVGLCIRDLDLSAGTIRISHSKTDQAGRGAVFQISPRTVASLKAWLTGSGLPQRDSHSVDTTAVGSPPVFVGILNDGSLRLGPDGAPSPMDGRTVARILQRHAESLGIAGVAGHSLRRSMARALYEAGVPEEEIVRKGRWSSLAQMREYVGISSPIKGASDLIF